MARITEAGDLCHVEGLGFPWNKREDALLDPFGVSNGTAKGMGEE